MQIFVTGATGQLGGEIPRAFAGHTIIPGARPDFDLADPRSIREAILRAQPELVIHAGAYTDVDGCERDPDRAYRVNALGTRHVALACREVGATLVAVSTDFVFDGTKGEPYLEWDEPRPLSVYGRSKLAGEREALALADRCFVVRTAWVYSPRGRNFVKTMLRLAGERPELAVVDDERGSPTLAGDLADGIARLVETRAYGVYHLTNLGACSRYELARQTIAQAGLPARITPVTSAEYLSRYPLPARRPADSTLRNVAGAAVGVELPAWDEALGRFLGSYLRDQR